MIIFNKKGAAALSTVLIIGAIVAEVAVASLIASYYVNQEGLGVKLSYNATMAAEAGVNDAILRVMRDKNYGNPTANYSISIGNASTAVSVTRVAGDSGDPADTTTINSTGSAADKKSKIQAVIYVNKTTGLININSIKEISVN